MRRAFATFRTEESSLKLLHLHYRNIAPDRSITNHRSFSNEVLGTEEYAGNIKP